jgi:hypothetical protein
LGEGPVHIMPFGLVHHVRELNHIVPMQVQVYHAGAGAIQLQEVVVRAVDGRELDRVHLYGDRMFLEVEEIPELNGGGDR